MYLSNFPSILDFCEALKTKQTVISPAKHYNF